ncbi:MAG TPA: DEAD/DEAH box helicase, partial [Conexibacter sp.]
MGELLPTLAARSIRAGLLEYLDTTFALADRDARIALTDFLDDPSEGIFRGPYLRLRLPFRPAAEGWRNALDWHPLDDGEGFAPYSHQAEAFARLSSAALGPERPRPLPTVVTTGTGSGKTEAFLYPILDHVRRAKARGVGGMKALVLYPMNALANDQAQRLAEMITTHPSLAGVTAGLFIGERGPTRTKVSADGLITDRHVIRSSAPDILLTNYKMLDQMLLREADAQIWAQSATSLQYLVLDEFHTYDGAQGTDVAMLLRRLGLTLKANGAIGERPLGSITPVATSATLGDREDPEAMLAFAETVFGEPFPADAVVTESRMDIDEWVGQEALPHGLVAVDGRELADAVDGLVAALGADPEPAVLAETVLSALYESDAGELSAAEQVRRHPLTRRLLEACADAAALRALAREVLPGASVEHAESCLAAYAGLLSHLRYTEGRSMPSVEVHLWTRELTRIDREASTRHVFAWSDDGGVSLGADDGDEREPFAGYLFPAIYCRHCGRSGWGVTLSPANSTDLDVGDADIRRDHANKKGKFRPLLLATREGEEALRRAGDGDPPVESLRWFHVAQRQILVRAPEGEAANDGSVLPVLTHADAEANERSRSDTCPACQQRDGIRFLGSAIATQLSVALSTLFGSTNLDATEKKTLVFTDSVQDAAHRAGFVQARSHSLTVRSVLREAVSDGARSLDTFAERVIERAGDDASLRYRLLPPDLADKEEFGPFWRAKTLAKVPRAVRGRVSRRLAFDATLEFGLQSRLGRTLELTGTVAAQVEAAPGVMLVAARQALAEAGGQLQLAGPHTDAVLLAWVRGVLEHMRERGAIEHPWLRKLVEEDGNRYFVWRGRQRSDGMPAFPIGRTAPAFPRVGPPPSGRENVLDSVAGAQSWYAQWAARSLSVSSTEGGALARLLLKRLAAAGVLTETSNKAGAEVYGILPSAVVVEPVAEQALVERRHLLVCQVCQAQVPGAAVVVDQLEGAPCMVTRCDGQMVRWAGDPGNFYRRFFSSHEVQRVIAREHTSLLDDVVRVAYENGFKGKADRPDAPNVLVATPTLEMGIDIGDLSTVMLSSLPRSVASYLQRVGRAGRLTGSALNLAFVSGRGDQLPQLGDPSSMINGKVRPPATYVDAEEILRRQYVASLGDVEARSADGAHPVVATGAIGSVDPGSYLHALAVRAETDAAHLEAFLAAFPTLASSARDALRVWVARDGEAELTSPLARRLLTESHRWRQQVELLGHRIAEIERSLPGLRHLAELPVATDDDRQAYNSAEASLRLTKRQRVELQGEYWISVMERAGIFPNYTLFDDSVTLDVGLSWLDPDSGSYETQTHAYQRNAARALRDFAPGATFYAGGHQVRINAVDLGNKGEAVRSWAFCARCGFSADVTDRAAPASCPRCGSRAISDVSQRIEVVELTRASSSMRRDEATIDDARDDRIRERFQEVVVADFTPADVTSQWYVKDFGFGAKHVKDLQLKWLNLGRAAGLGATRLIAGAEVNA